MKVRGINHATLQVASLERSLPFYVDFLGMSLVHRGSKDVYLEWGSAWICLLERPVSPRSAESVNTAGMDHMAFSIEEADFHEASKKLLDAGVSVVRGPVYRGGGWSINFLDPDGIELELFTGSLAERMKVWT
ncbi:glutathione transferase [Paenibacillus sp. H1-7]|uniref:VOC family protein n=1 Tax=Paenibacillus sp. H1-7 TaxID=2282849 RepID=UPI001EF90530|nr:VOC family protein [Paenibacillus sp. H1-7]ULL19802.1 glutathione transferase [Paenibacillus sp. H1-7]